MADDMVYCTPVGRIIEGSVHTASDIGYEKKKMDKARYFIGLAVSKHEPEMNGILQALWGVACAFYHQNPYVMSNIQRGFEPDTNFSWKVVNGDSPKYHDKPLYKGNWIFKFSTQFLLTCVSPQNTPIDPKSIERGYWARIGFTVKPNGKLDGTAGLFLNPQIVRLERTDEIIRNAPAIDPTQLFGAPVAGAPGGYPGMPAVSGGAPSYAPPTPAYAPPVASPPATPGYGTYAPSPTTTMPPVGSAPSGYVPPVAAPTSGYSVTPANPGSPYGAPPAPGVNAFPQPQGALPASAPVAQDGATSLPAPGAVGTASPTDQPSLVQHAMANTPRLPQ
jgi:hypothetical protein